VRATVYSTQGPNGLKDYPVSCEDINWALDDLDLVLNSFLQASDLPEGWYLDDCYAEIVEDTTIYIRGFRVAHDPALDYIFVTQDLILGEDESQAKQIFAEIRESEYSALTEGRSPTAVDFQSKADQFSLGCIPGTPELDPETLCEGVARYGNLVSDLRAKILEEGDEELWFTWSDLERVLEAMDDRALEARGQ
jgi:hypothetical protein